MSLLDQISAYQHDGFTVGSPGSIKGDSTGIIGQGLSYTGGILPGYDLLSSYGSVFDQSYQFANTYSADQTVMGGDTNDVLLGGFGNDILIGDRPGVASTDFLVGVDNSYYNAGTGEFDLLYGGLGQDVFYLGDLAQPYYLGNGYATISDFTLTDADAIIVHGNASQYTVSLANDGFAYGTRIDYLGDTVGFVQNVSPEQIVNNFIFFG